MKYVMFKKETKSLTQYVPVIFPNNLVHKDIADSLLKGALKGFTVHSGGDINSYDMPDVSGSSSSLELESDTKDVLRLRLCDYGGNYE